MRLKLFPIGLMLLLAVFLFPGTTVLASTDSSSYGFEVSIAPEQNHPGVFQAKFTVTEIGSKKIVAEPTIRFRAGEPAQTSVEEDQSGLAFQFSVSVNETGSIASYKAEAIQSGKTVSRSEARISLSK